MNGAMVNGYPVVLWSEFWGAPGMNKRELRAHKLMMLGYIDVVSQRINAHISRSVDTMLEKTVDAAQGLRDKLAKVDQVVFHTGDNGSRGLRQDLTDAMSRLRDYSAGYHKLETIPDAYQAAFKATEVNLYHRKEFQRQLNGLLNSVVGSLDHINAINSRLDDVLAQIAQLKELNGSPLPE